ncbi:MAG: hypothetical protein V4792_20445 [Pseudomonadota bacterium]
MLTNCSTMPAWAMATDIPAPEPNVVPLPPSPHPVPPAPATPPEVQDPVLPGQNEPVRDPVPPEAIVVD